MANLFGKKEFKVDVNTEEMQKSIFNTLNIPDLSCDLRRGIASVDLAQKIEINTEPKKEDKDEWIWVAGFKGTDKDMKCRDFQYEMSTQFDMDKDEEVKTCSNGFHLCLEIDDVFDWYAVGDGNRYFRVNALVRKKDYDKYYNQSFFNTNRKLVAKSIVFISEIMPEDIYGNVQEKYFTFDMPNSYMHYAFEKSVEYAREIYITESLVADGYSYAFANYIANKRIDKFEIAHALAGEKDLSMDVKILTIFK